MVDRRSEIFQVASSAAAVAALLLVALRQLGAHVAKHVFAEIDGEAFNPKDKAPLLMAAYHRALETNWPLPVTLQDARRSLELITALYHAAETGTAVALPIGKEHPKYGGWRPQATAPRR
jgi:hypothetical protein